MGCGPLPAGTSPSLFKTMASVGFLALLLPPAWEGHLLVPGAPPECSFGKKKESGHCCFWVLA